MSEVRPHVRFVLALAAVLLLAAACGGGDESPEGASTGATGATAATGTTGSTGATGDQGSGAATVRAVNFAFDPAQVEVASGDTIEVRNTTPSTPHTFTVDGTDIDVSLGGMESQTVTIDLDPGTYDFHCEIHPQMTGTLTVT
ncbi:MAG TPA: cupredoxin domain-containing protein [Actinomycetota bacterium]|jgi:plastocyanin|nr:cupredoxin domain-containing protein [Actinomycetota bacterium]